MKRVKAFEVKSKSKSAEPLTKIKLKQVGDVELWYAEGRDKSWMLPLLVYWKTDVDTGLEYAVVAPALSMYHSQHVALCALFEPHDLLEQGRSIKEWLVRRHSVPALIQKATGLTYSYYYKWPEGDCPPLPAGWSVTKTCQLSPPEPERDGTDAPFIKFICKESGLPSSVVNMVFKTICKHATKYLLEHRGVIEFGFCTMVALPLRVNWKQIVLEKLKRFRMRKLFYDTATDLNTRYARLDEIGLASALTSPHNVALRNGKVSHTLEVIPTARFRASVLDVENRRIANSWASRIKLHEDTVEKFYDVAIRALDNYCEEVSYPFAKVSVSGNGGIIRFVSAGGGKQIKASGVSFNDLPVYIIPPDSGFSVLAGQSDPRVVSSPVEKVRPVPAVLPEADVLRTGVQTGNLEKPGGQGGDAGVLVRHDEEGNVSGRPVLPVPEVEGREPSGVE